MINLYLSKYSTIFKKYQDLNKLLLIESFIAMNSILSPEIDLVH